MEQQESAKFIQYMAKKLKVSSQKELEDALTNMGEEKLKAAYDEYKQGGDEPTEYGDGGSLEYIKCLNFLKKGGVMDCGCGSKMKKGGPVVPKAFLGALLGAGKALMAGSKLAGTGIKAMGTMAKAGKFMGNASKVMNAGQQILGVAQQFKNPTPGITQQLPTTQVGINPGIAPALNPVIAQNTPTLRAQSIPTLTPAGQQIQPVKPMYSEDGGKLDKIKKLNAFKGKKTKGLEGPGATMMHKEGGKVSEFGAAFSGKVFTKK